MVISKFVSNITCTSESILVLCLFGEGISACFKLQAKKKHKQKLQKSGDGIWHWWWHLALAMASDIGDGIWHWRWQKLKRLWVFAIIICRINRLYHVGLRSPWFLCGLFLGHSMLEVQWIGRGPSLLAKKAGIGNLGSHSAWKHDPAAISNLASD